MRDVLYPDFAPSDPNPMKRAQNAMARQVLPKRFYKSVEVSEKDGGFAISLDGRPARTPGRNLLALPTHAAAAVIAAEWEAQADVIDPARMHATRIANTAIDSLGGRIAEVQADIAGYAGSDLVCYRAGEPEGLVERQNAAWNPVVAWAVEALGARMILAEGVVHQQQTPDALAAVAAAVAQEAQPIRLAALHVLTTLSGSCLIAMMLRAGALDADAAFAASNVDEDWNAHLWGRDAEAETRLARRREEFHAAAALLLACQMPAITRLA
jgi:chaperone required for assembly of F1-ATPase